MKGRTPTAEEKRWMSEISEFGCCVCKKFFGVTSPPEIHHIGGKTKPDAHFNTIPLCYQHHRSGESNEKFVSRHPFKTQFVEKYGKEHDLREYTREKIGWDK